MTQAVLTAGHWTTNAAMMEDVLRLWMPAGGAVLDMTWGKGNFWNERTLAHYEVTGNDINPDVDCEHHFDYQELPSHLRGEFDGVVFDPPYVVRGGRSESSSWASMNKAFGLMDAPTTPEALAEQNHRGLRSCFHAVKRNGLVFVKYTNPVSSGRRVWQIDALNHYAQDALRLQKVDEFIFYTKNARAQPPRTRKDGKPSVQKHSRNNTSTLLVYRRTYS